MKKIISLTLGLLTLGCACTTTKSSVTIGRISKDDQAAQKIEQAQVLYDMGETEAAIASLSQLVDKSAYTDAHDYAYQLLVTWLLTATRYQEAKQYASYFLKHHQISSKANDIVELFKAYDLEQKEEEIIKQNISPEEYDQENTVEIDDIDGHIKIELKEAQPNTLGILLPLSGPFASFGKRALAAMSVGLDMPLNPNGLAYFVNQSTGLRVIVADTEGDALKTHKIINELAHKYNVALLIGDITFDASIMASNSASHLRIPLLCLSRHPLTQGMSSYVFSFSWSLEQHIKALVDHAIRQGQKRFAILYPRHNFGIDMAKTFYTEVIRQGGVINALEAYDVHQTTFTNEVKKLVGLYHISLRPEFNECQKNKSQTLKAKQVKTCLEATPPLVDFDALFIPDYSKIALIIPALRQADILISNDNEAIYVYKRATKNSHIKPVQLLGANSWNDPDTIAKLKNMANGAFYMDAFDTNDEALMPLNKLLNKPGSLEVFAHDAAFLAKKILSHQKNKPIRENIKKQLAQYQGPGGILQDMRFSPSQELMTKILGFEINDGSSSVITIE